jgi:hypothetical protein
VTVELTTQGVIVEGDSESGTASTCAVGAWTEADLTVLNAAIRQGAKRVRYAGPPEREVEYQSLNEMLRLRAAMVASICKGPTHRYALFRRGFGRGRSMRFRRNG